MTTLAEELPAQQARCREILEHAVAIGPARKTDTQPWHGTRPIR